MADILQAAQDQINEAAQKLSSQTPSQGAPPVGIGAPLPSTVSTQAGLTPPPPPPAAPPVPTTPVTINPIPTAAMPPTPPPQPVMPAPMAAAPVPQVETFSAPQQFSSPPPLMADATPTIVVPPQGVSVGGGKKGGGGRIFAVLTILLLAALIPAGAWYLSSSQRSVAPEQPKAAICCNAGSCNDGWSYGDDPSAPQESCDQRAQEACQNHGGPASGGGQCSGGGGGSQRCTASNGSQGETCDNLGKCDVNGGCNPACGGGSSGYAPSGQTCDVPNGYCQTGFSCRPNGTGFHLRCVGNQCVQQLCPNGEASCANACTGHSQCSTTTVSPTPDPSTACRYVTNGDTVSVTGNCTGYTFRALVFQCNGPLSQSSSGRCEDKGIHPAFESIVTDQSGATSVSLGGVPACKSRQADLIVTGRPANDGLSGDELPGSPRIPNYLLRDGDFSNCGGPGPLTCSALAVLDSSNSDITALLRNGSRRLRPNEQVTLVGARGTSAAARFRAVSRDTTAVTELIPWQYVAQATGSEFRQQLTIPSSFTNNSFAFEVELCPEAPGTGNACASGWR